jgi:four helix bundle protein
MGDSYKDLIVWQRAIELCLEIYRLTANFPAAERFGLTNQLRRAAVSIASNIAEGYGRASTGEYRLFLGHARGSNCELQTQLILSKALEFGPENTFDQAETLSADVSRLLIAIMKKIT